MFRSPCRHPEGPRPVIGCRTLHVLPRISHAFINLPLLLLLTATGCCAESTPVHLPSVDHRMQVLRFGVIGNRRQHLAVVPF